MSKKEESQPIRAKLIFKGNKTEYWDCANTEQLSQALKDDFAANGRIPVKISIRKEAEHA